MPLKQFGNSTAFLISNNDIKKEVINFIFKSINPYDFHYEIIDNHSHLPKLKTHTFFISPNFKGTNYFMIFKNILGKNRFILVNKKNFKYNKEHINFYDIKMYELNSKYQSDLYLGTIIDGKFISSNNKHFFLPLDIFFFKGNKYTHIDIHTKYNELFLIDKDTRYFTWKINKLYSYDKIESFINQTLPNTSIDNCGIIFIPQYSNIYYIFNEPKQQVVFTNQNDNQDVFNDFDILRDMTQYLHSRTYNYETFNKKKNFFMSITDIPDVYYLKNNITDTKYFIASIPSLKISHTVKSWFNNTKKISAECVYNQQFDKWIPINLISQL